MMMMTMNMMIDEYSDYDHDDDDDDMDADDDDNLCLEHSVWVNIPQDEAFQSRGLQKFGS